MHSSEDMKGEVRIPVIAVSSEPGKGANFILPSEERFRVLVVAQLEVRIQHIAKDFKKQKGVL